MAIEDDLLEELSQTLSDARQCGYDSQSKSNDIFEGYVWSMIVQAARDQGATVYYETVQELPTAELVFRTSPGSIYSTAQAYTHAVISFDGAVELELHIGIMVAGTSRVLHECDVALITRDEGSTCRSQNVHPRCAAVVLAIECKFYSSNLPVDLGRSFLGPTSEIHRRGRYLVTNSDSASVVSLLNHHKLEWDVGVLPDRPEALSLVQSIGRKLRNYRTP